MQPVSRIRSAGVLALALSATSLSVYPEDFDLVVYGGTAGGITVAQGDVLYFQFDRHRAAAGLGYSIEESGDLDHWHPAPRPILHAPVQDHGEVQQIRIPVRSADSLAEGGGFFRLHVLA